MSDKVIVSIVVTIAVSCPFLLLTTKRKSVYLSLCYSSPFENRVDVSENNKCSIKFSKMIEF